MVASLNKPNKTITIHKPDCSIIRNKFENLEILNKHPNGYKEGQNQLWFSEENLSIDKIKDFFGDLDYGKVFCSKCFKN